MQPVSVANRAAGLPSQLCILVVEDEFLIRIVVSETLRDAGYTVVEAVSADEALALFRSERQMDLVFSDVRMPGSLDGLELLRLVKGAEPSLPVITTSGHCDPTLALSAGATEFLRKPYDLAEVLDLCAKALAR